MDKFHKEVTGKTPDLSIEKKAQLIESVDTYIESPEMKEYVEKLRTQREAILQKAILSLMVLEKNRRSPSVEDIEKIVDIIIRDKLDLEAKSIPLETMAHTAGIKRSLEGIKDKDQRDAAEHVYEQIQETKNALLTWNNKYTKLSADEREGKEGKKLRREMNAKGFFSVGENDYYSIDVRSVVAAELELQKNFVMTVPPSVQQLLKDLDGYKSINLVTLSEYLENTPEEFVSFQPEHIQKQVDEAAKKYGASSPLKMIGFLGIGTLATIISLPMISNILRGKGLQQSPFIPLAWIAVTIGMAKPELFRGAAKTYATKLRNGAEVLHDYLGTGDETAKIVQGLLSIPNNTVEELRKVIEKARQEERKPTTEELKKAGVPEAMIQFFAKLDGKAGKEFMRGVQNVAGKDKGSKRAQRDLLELIKHVDPKIATEELQRILAMH